MPKTTGTAAKRMGFRPVVYGVEKLMGRLKVKSKQVKRVRSVGVQRAGRWLYEHKRELCKQGLYSGQEVAPNRWRYGWQYLGGPAKYHFTKNLLNAHRLGKLVMGHIDRIEVFIDIGQAPYAALIHGPMEGATYFQSPRLDKMVRTRPWMRITEEETVRTAFILHRTYKGY